MKKRPVKKKAVRKDVPVKKKRKIPTGIPQTAGANVEVRKRQKGKRVKVSAREMRNVIADTLERLHVYPHGDPRIDVRATCEQKAEVVVREIVYGLNELGYTKSSEPITEVVEVEYPKIPFCRKHK